MNQHTPLAYRAANDRAPREKRPMVVRFADAISKAMLVVYTGAFIGVIAALALGIPQAAWLFLGAAISSGLTEILVCMFRARLHG